MNKTVYVIGGGLAGSEAALQLAARGVNVTLLERRPRTSEPVHKTGLLAELVCSNSFKSSKPASAAGLLKRELECLKSQLWDLAIETQVPAGGSVAVDRTLFAERVTRAVDEEPRIGKIHGNVLSVEKDGSIVFEEDAESRRCLSAPDAIIVATGPLTQGPFASCLECATGAGQLAFFDAAAPIVAADSLDYARLFRQSRYVEGDAGDYLNAAFTKEEYEAFIDALVEAKRVVAKDFESSELFQACQPIEEVARSGRDAPRFGTLKPVGLTDPATGKRPWAVLQLRAEDAWGQSYNLVGCQTNLTFSEQQRVFRMVPGLSRAEFVRYGVMHRNTFVDAPRCMDAHQRLTTFSPQGRPVYLAGQISGTEGYTEAIRSGLNAAVSCFARLSGIEAPYVPRATVYGALIAYSTSPDTLDYQPMHVNFGLLPPLDSPIKNKGARYEAYASRAEEELRAYAGQLRGLGLL